MQLLYIMQFMFEIDFLCKYWLKIFSQKINSPDLNLSRLDSAN